MGGVVQAVCELKKGGAIGISIFLSLSLFVVGHGGRGGVGPEGTKKERRVERAALGYIDHTYTV